MFHSRFVCLLLASGVAGGAAPVLDRLLRPGVEAVQGVGVDGEGNVYVAGSTRVDIPLLNALQSEPGAGNCSSMPDKAYARCEDLFVQKYDPTGTTLLYSTYLGTDARDVLRAMRVDRAGNVYLVGSVYAVGSADPVAAQLVAGFLIKLAAGGGSIVYRHDWESGSEARGVALDEAGNAYVAGTSRALEFAAVQAAVPELKLRTLVRSRDGGASWEALGVPRAVEILGLARDPE